MTISEKFREMADKVDKNSTEPFGGALVIVPPGDNPAIEMLILDSRQDVLHFWTQVKTVVDVAQNEYLTKAKNQQAWGVR